LNEKFGVFIPKLSHALGKSLSPVLILHSQQVADMNFDNFPENKFLRIERSEFFQFIKESNCHIAVVNELRKI
jgi:hypothetical protein